MYKDFVGSKVIAIVATKGEKTLEYTGKLVADNEKTIELENVNIDGLVYSSQKGMFGNIAQYKVDVKKAIINKEYIVACMIAG